MNAYSSRRNLSTLRYCQWVLRDNLGTKLFCKHGSSLTGTAFVWSNFVLNSFHFNLPSSKTNQRNFCGQTSRSIGEKVPKMSLLKCNATKIVG